MRCWSGSPACAPWWNWSSIRSAGTRRSTAWSRRPSRAGSRRLRSASEIAFELARALGRRSLQVEAAHEAALLVHEVDQRRVVHGVAAALERHLAGEDLVVLQHRVDGGALAGKADDMRVEARQIGLEQFRIVALG